LYQTVVCQLGDGIYTAIECLLSIGYRTPP
jgi:hypothetical protein